MTPEEYREAIIDRLDCAANAYFSDAKQAFQLSAITLSLMWIAEELHEVNERCKDGSY